MFSKTLTLYTAALTVAYMDTTTEVEMSEQVTYLNNGNQVRTDICDWGTCGNNADYVFTARATNVPGGGDATAERRPTCWRHACQMSQTEPGTFELWHKSGQLMNV